MIVQTIEISLSKGRAPDLLAHVAESGREIEMIPDVELSADDYTAEIDTVKPDGTFTMTNCTIDTDGHIIAPIIEQAVAVKGLCHYIIKIYNDDIVIYSACGSLWVDDHLVTDDMIESIAEVNGYRFPQDFATLDDIPGADDFIDDNTVLSDKTWSSDKINDELSQISTLHEYSTSEKVVGKWIDGKPLYEITLSLTITGTSTNILNASAIDIREVFGVLTRDDQLTFNIPFIDSSDFITVSQGSGNVILRCSNWFVSANVKHALITLRYVKTTD